MKVGDRIRLDLGWHGMYSDLQDFTVEEFRYCLGVFLSDEDRQAVNLHPCATCMALALIVRRIT